MALWARVVLLALVCAHVAADQVSCWNDTACPSSAPRCYRWATHTINAALKSAGRKGIDIPDGAVDNIEGVCVQCSSDCHCGVNQYCGIDPNEGNRVKFRALTGASFPVYSLDIGDSLKNELDGVFNASKGLVGLPMPSVCLDYSVPSSKCVPQESQTQIWPTVQYVTGSGYDSASGASKAFTSTKTGNSGDQIPLQQALSSPPGTITKAFTDSGKFCGALSPTSSDAPGVAPSFYSYVGGFSGIPVSTLPDNHNYLMNTANPYSVNFCSKAVLYSGPPGAGYQAQNMIRAQCGISFSYTSPNVAIAFSSPAVAWQGTCVAGACKVCVNGNKRCLNDANAIPQICIGGQWVEYKWSGLSEADADYMQYTSADAFFTSPRMVSGLMALVAIAFFLAVIFVAVILIYVASAGKAPAPAPAQAQAPAAQHAPAAAHTPAPSADVFVAPPPEKAAHAAPPAPDAHPGGAELSYPTNV